MIPNWKVYLNDKPYTGDPACPTSPTKPATVIQGNRNLNSHLTRLLPNLPTGTHTIRIELVTATSKS